VNPLRYEATVFRLAPKIGHRLADATTSSGLLKMNVEIVLIVFSALVPNSNIGTTVQSSLIGKV
jgi:hypothetical protein